MTPEQAQRIERAARALDAYRAIAGDDEPLSTLGDLLADLMHWAQWADIDFAAALGDAGSHYEDERAAR